jgi:beta-lactamase regulating signal transducer with metallopeptidase domain
MRVLLFIILAMATGCCSSDNPYVPYRVMQNPLEFGAPDAKVTTIAKSAAATNATLVITNQTLLIGAALIAVPATIMWKTARNHMKRKRTDERPDAVSATLLGFPRFLRPW